MEPTFFLKSKRFWAMPAAWAVGWAGAKLAAAGFDLPPGSIETVTATIVSVIVWLFGMWQGRRPVSILPVKGGGTMLQSHALAGLLAAGILLALAACGTVDAVKEANKAAKTFEQKLFAVEGSFVTAQRLLAAYLPDLPDGAVKRRIKQAEAAANAAIDTAHQARRGFAEGKGDVHGFELTVIAAEGALDILMDILRGEGVLSRSSADPPGADPPGADPPGADPPGAVFALIVLRETRHG